jgi:tetratricopeptide (TPR) repeat protein
MRNVFAFFALILLLAVPGPATAQESSGPQSSAPESPAPESSAPEVLNQQVREAVKAAAPATPNMTLAQKKAARLDELFASLKRESNAVKASRIATQIQSQWQNSGSATVDLMMGWAAKAIEDKKYAMAMDFLDQVTVMRPDYAEGWNRRATVNFLNRDYGRSMADIRRTLALEPRHFGAITGMAAILKSNGQTEAAFHALERALEVYPMLREAQREAGELAEQLAGQRT